MTVPGQRIGYNGPGCLGMIGLLVISLLIVLGAALWVFLRFGPFFHADTGGTAGTEVCQIIHHVNAASTQKCFRVSTTP